MQSTFWRYVMGLLFVLVTYLGGGLMPCVSPLDPLGLVLTVFGLRPTIILTVESRFVSCVLYRRSRSRFTLFSGALSIMRSEGDFTACFGIVLLFQISLVTVIRDALHFIFRRLPCFGIVLYSHYFLTDILLLSSLLLFSHPYLLYVVSRGRLVLPDHVLTSDLSDPGHSLPRDCRSRLEVLYIRSLLLRWLTSFCLERTPSPYCCHSLYLSSSSCFCCLLFSDTVWWSCCCQISCCNLSVP